MSHDAQATPPATPESALGTSPVAPSPAAPVDSATTRSITVTMRTSAPPEHVWAAWADPEKIAHWFVDRAYGDVRAGGVMTWVFDQFKYEIPYPVLEANAPERLVFGGEIPGYPPFRLEINIAREGGETVLRLFNSGFRTGAQWDDEYQGVASGWQTSLAVLRHYLEHHYGTPKRTVMPRQPAVFEYRDVLAWFTEERRLAQWLTRSGSIGKVGDAVHLTLRSGETLRGTVLAVTRQEAAVSWDDENATLELKAFSMGPNRVVAARVTGWGMSDARLAALNTSLSDAVARLAATLG